MNRTKVQSIVWMDCGLDIGLSQPHSIDTSANEVSVCALGSLRVTARRSYCSAWIWATIAYSTNMVTFYRQISLAECLRIHWGSHIIKVANMNAVFQCLIWYIKMECVCISICLSIDLSRTRYVCVCVCKSAQQPSPPWFRVLEFHVMGTHISNLLI